MFEDEPHGWVHACLRGDTPVSRRQLGTGFIEFVWDSPEAGLGYDCSATDKKIPADAGIFLYILKSVVTAY